MLFPTLLSTQYLGDVRYVHVDDMEFEKPFPKIFSQISAVIMPVVVVHRIPASPQGADLSIAEISTPYIFVGANKKEYALSHVFFFFELMYYLFEDK